MRKSIFIPFIAAILSLSACQDVRPEESWTEASYDTIEAFSGVYCLASALWSAPIDLSGFGVVTDDMLLQLNLSGWTGVQSASNYSGGVSSISNILMRSIVLSPESPTSLAQINLYVPFPEGRKDAFLPLEKTDRCSIDMEPYQCHYKVNSFGEISFYNVTDREFRSEGGRLTNVKIRFEGCYIFFDADTSMYDWSTSAWQDGHMSLKYARY